MELSQITPVAQDYLKVIWSATEWDGAPITTTGLARRMGTTAPEAERLEYAVSGTMIERISAQLDHPEVDPHGDPIPTAAGEVHRPAGAVALAEVAEGECVVARVSDSDPGLLVRLRERGVCPGARLSADPAGTVVRVHRGRGSVSLSTEDAAAVWVVPCGPTG